MEIYPGIYCIRNFNTSDISINQCILGTKLVTRLTAEFSHLLADSVLVYGPDSGNVCGEQLVLGQGGIASSGTDEPGLSHCVVPDNHTLDGLDIWPLIVHIRIHKMGPKNQKFSFLKK